MAGEGPGPGCKELFYSHPSWGPRSVSLSSGAFLHLKSLEEKGELKIMSKLPIYFILCIRLSRVSMFFSSGFGKAAAGLIIGLLPNDFHYAYIYSVNLDNFCKDLNLFT